MGLTKLQFKKLKIWEDELRFKNYSNGYRMVITCNTCNTKCYAKDYNDISTCKCGNVTISENHYYYKEGISDRGQVKVSMVKYSELAE